MVQKAAFSASARTTAARMSPTDRLIEVIQELSAARDLPAVMAIVRGAARALTGADGATFVLREDDQCFYADEDAIAPLWKGHRFPMDACVSGWAMLHREPVVIEDIHVDPRIPADAYAPTFVKSLVMVPIRTKDPAGAIGTYWAARHRASASEVALLSALADSTSIAMENVSLYAEMRRALDEARIARESAERASKLKSAFLGMISHELRTPLAALSLQLERLFIELADGPSNAPSERVGAIRGSTDRLRDAIESLLEQARIEAGRLSLELEQLDPERHAAQVVDLFRDRARAKGLRIELAVNRPVPALRTDARLLRVALCHLVENAIKFTPSGSVRVSVAAGDGRVAFAVSDTGPGIDGPDRIRVFEPFEQLEPVRNKHGAGIGLGLALARSIVTALGGTLELDSKLGAGSTFTLSLPTS